MKYFSFLIVSILLGLSFASLAQAPQKISYQAVIRNASNNLIANTKVGMLIIIAKDSANGTVAYGEQQSPTTNANGLVSLTIGNGTPLVGTLAGINWGSGNYFIKALIDPTGGNAYTITSTGQLLSVPYALHSANGNPTGNTPGDMQYWNGTKWVLIPAGANGATLTMCNGVPTWGGCATGTGLATVVTTSATALTKATALCSGNVTSDGGATVTDRGFCYATTANPTIANSVVNSGTGTGTYTTTLSGLAANTLYYVRAYATNSNGTAYGTQVSFTTPANTATVVLGQSYAGGIVFYVDSTGSHGLVAAPTDQSGAIVWWNGSYLNTKATGTAVGTGQTNTASIINYQGSGSYAATLCSQSFNGYNDWFLPSKDELQLMYNNLHAKGLGSFTGGFYYSSSEFDVYQAWTLDFMYNSSFGYYKNNQARVRAVRKF